jgi:hypothetical protein
VSVRDVLRGIVRWLAVRAQRWAERVLAADASGPPAGAPSPAGDGPPAHWRERVRGVTEWMGVAPQGPRPPRPPRPAVPPRTAEPPRVVPTTKGVARPGPRPRPEAAPAPRLSPLPRSARPPLAPGVEVSATRHRVLAGSPVPGRPPIRPLPALALPEDGKEPEAAPLPRPVSPEAVAASGRPRGAGETVPPAGHSVPPLMREDPPPARSPEEAAAARTFSRGVEEPAPASPSASGRDALGPPANPERRAPTPIAGSPERPLAQERPGPSALPSAPRPGPQPRAADAPPDQAVTSRSLPARLPWPDLPRAAARASVSGGAPPPRPAPPPPRWSEPASDRWPELPEDPTMVVLEEWEAFEAWERLPAPEGGPQGS